MYRRYFYISFLKMKTKKQWFALPALPWKGGFVKVCITVHVPWKVNQPGGWECPFVNWKSAAYILMILPSFILMYSIVDPYIFLKLYSQYDIDTPISFIMLVICWKFFFWMHFILCLSHHCHRNKSSLTTLNLASGITSNSLQKLTKKKKNYLSC